MNALTESDIRSAFRNTTLSERKAVAFPTPLAEVDWESLDYFGWRNPKLPLVGYIAVEVDDELVALQLKQAESAPRSRAQCSWCADVTLPNDVTLFTARRAGDAGRRGDTVGTLICARFECSKNVRVLPPSAYTGFDREAARDRRIEMLRENVAGFARDVRG